MAATGNGNGLPSSIYDITPGTQLLVTLAGLDERLKTSFVGLERGRFFMFKTPQGSSRNGVYDYLYAGNQLRVSYLFEGNIWGFASRIQAYTATPHPLVFTDFPQAIESHNLRKEQRIECYFPVQVTIGGSAHQAMIVDLSLNGCSLTMPENCVGDGPRPGEEITIESPLFGAQGEARIQAEVRRASCDGKTHLNLGLTFRRLDPGVDSWIKDYIAQVLGLFTN